MDGGPYSSVPSGFSSVITDHTSSLLHSLMHPFIYLGPTEVLQVALCWAPGALHKTHVRGQETPIWAGLVRTMNTGSEGSARGTGESCQFCLPQGPGRLPPVEVFPSHSLLLGSIGGQDRNEYA